MRCRRRLGPSVLAAAAILGCSGSESPGAGADAGPGEDASLWEPVIAEPAPPASPAAPEPPAPPARPELPRLTPCPDGWGEAPDPDDPDLLTCDPWPAGRQQDCAEDEAHFPGAPACERIGPACPDGEWADDLPEDSRVLYVRAGEPDGGDGTRDRPFGWIADAVAAAGERDVIALSKGLFDEEVRIERAVTLIGACVLETRIAPTGRGSEGALAVRAAAVVRNLQVGGAQRGVDVQGVGAAAVLDSVLVREATGFGVIVTFGGTLEASGLVVRDTRDDEGELGFGLEVWAGAEATLERAVLERNRTVGVWVGEAATLAATNLVVSDTSARESDGNFGYGFQVFDGAQVTLDLAVLERNHADGMLVTGDGTSLTATDLAVSDTQPQETSGAWGLGLEIREGARVTLERAVLERNRTAGLSVAGEGTVLAGTDIVVSDSQPQESNGISGAGLEIREGAEVTLERAVFARNMTAGLWVRGASTTVTGSDVTVRDTQPQRSDGMFGVGLEVRDGAEVTLDRARFERNRYAGLWLGQGGAVLTVADLVVSDTRGRASDGASSGLFASGGADVTVERAVFERNREVGLVAGEGTTLTGRDLVISETRGHEATGDYGIGMSAVGAEVNLERAVLERNHMLGLVAYGATLTARDLRVSGTEGQESDGAYGFGLQASEAARIMLERAVLEGNRTAGLMIADEGTVLAGTDVVVSDTLAQLIDGSFGYGLQTYGGAEVSLQRAVFERNRTTGVRIGGEGTVLRATDLLVSGTQPMEGGGGLGHGLDGTRGAQVTLERATLEQNHSIGLLVEGAGTMLTATDLAVTDTQAQESDAHFGYGMFVRDGGRAELVRSRIVGNRGYGLDAYGPGTVVTAEELVVGGTEEQACALDTCSDTAGGFGLASEEGATLEVSRFRSADNAMVGALVASESGLDLHEGVISSNRIGVNIQVDGYDLDRLRDRVSYVDNDVNTDSMEFALPESPPPLDTDPEHP